MAGKSTLRVILCGALMGLTVGLLVVFAMFMTAFLGARTTPPEQTQDQKMNAFMAMARDEWSFKQKDPDHILGRIAVVQARSGDTEGAKQTIDKIGKLDKSAVQNVAVYDKLYYKVSPTEAPKQEVIDQAKAIAQGIQDPLLKADALRRVAEIEERVSADAAKKTLREAAQVVVAAPPLEKPATFNTWWLLWPAALTTFGLLFALLSYGLLTGLGLLDAPGSESKPRTRVAAAEAKDEEEEDEQESDVELVGQAPVQAAETPPEAAEMPAVPPPPPPEPAATPARTAVAPGAASAAPARTAVGVAAAPVAAPSAADKATLLAKQQAQATMLAKQAQATMLAKQQSKPTQIAPPEEANQ